MQPASLFVLSLALLCARYENLTTAIHATIRAGVVRQPGFPAIWTRYQLWQFEMMMRSPITLASMGSSLFG